MAEDEFSKAELSDFIKSCDSPTLSKSSQSYQFESTHSTMLRSNDTYGKPSLKVPINLSADSLSQKLSNIYASELNKYPEKISELTSPEPLASPSPEMNKSYIEAEIEDTSKNTLFQWLSEIGLNSLFGVLIGQGYDDLKFLLEQMRSNPLTLEILEEFGVHKIGHRMILLAHLEEETQKFCRKSFPIKSSCCSKQPAQPAGHLKDWLLKINLPGCYKLFIDNGFVSLEQICYLMNSDYPLTDEVLQEIGIYKIGYRQRILLKLREDTSKNYSISSPSETTSKTAICGDCSIF